MVVNLVSLANSVLRIWFQSFIGDVCGSKFDTLKTWGCLVGHPYLASLWLGFLFVKRSYLKGFCVIAWLCSFCCQATLKLLRIRLTKGFKDPFVILRAHSCV